MRKKKQVIIQTRNLTKKYGDFTVVDDLNLMIEQGEIFGLLGPNGSGKTTIILMLLGLTEPTSGDIRVMGHDPIREPFEVKRIVGYLPERLGFYENLTAAQNLRYFARLNGISDEEMEKSVPEKLLMVGLGNKDDQKVSTFSRGMKQRLGIANVLMKDPKLIILDEPTQGIDPKGIQEILHLFTTINEKEKITIMLSSHLIHHVQQICDNIGIMSRGKMRMRGRVDMKAFNEEQNYLIELEVANLSENLIYKLEKLPNVYSVENQGTTLTVTSRNDIRSQIANTVINNGGALTNLRLQERSLINIYEKYSEEQ